MEVIRGKIALSASCMGLSRYLPSPPTQMAALLPRTCLNAFPVGQLFHPFVTSSLPITPQHSLVYPYIFRSLEIMGKRECRCCASARLLLGKIIWCGPPQPIKSRQILHRLSLILPLTPSFCIPSRRKWYEQIRNPPERQPIGNHHST